MAKNLTKAEAQERAVWLTSSVIGAYSALDGQTKSVWLATFHEMCQAYASANFGYQGWRDGDMITLDQADFVMAALQVIARNLGEKYEQAACHEVIEEMFRESKEREKASERASGLYYRHHNPAKSQHVAQSMMALAKNTHARLWWKQVLDILKERYNR